MKIRTITCHHVYNHGALLQAWALASYLRGLNHDVKIIDYRPSEFFKLSVNNPKYDKFILRWVYKLLKYPTWKRSLRRKKVFDVFYERYMSELTSEVTYRSYFELNNNPPVADVYIAGSDQIWNTNFKHGRNPAFFLGFGPKQTLRLSYAASFATESIAPGWSDFVSKNLANFNYISVRENSGVRLAENLGFTAEKVLDPVFLIPRTVWDTCFDSKLGKGDNYILVYDCEGGDDIKICATRLAKLTNTKIYSIGPRNLSYADKNFVNNGPDDFVSLIRYSKCVLSNSFHGSVFSMIFNRDFFVINRQDGLNIRMVELLSSFGLEDRLIDRTVSNETLLKSIDYISINTLIFNEILASKKWLNSHLK